MSVNIIIKVSRQRLDRICGGEENPVTIPANHHWKRKLKNPRTKRYYTNLRVVVRTYQEEPDYVISAVAGNITLCGDVFTIELREARVLLPPFNHKLINEPMRNSLR